MSAKEIKILNSMEECSACRRISECETLPYINGYFCEVCLDELVLASNGCAFSLISEEPLKAGESEGRRERFHFCSGNHALARHTTGDYGTESIQC